MVLTVADCFTPDKRSWVMGQIQGRDTKPELSLRRMLHQLGYRYGLHRADLPGKPDLTMPKHGLLVYVHGCFWHGHDCKDGRRPKSNRAYWNRKLDRNIERDQQNLERAKEGGWKTVVVWECEIKKEPEEAVNRVLQKVDRHE